MQPVPSVLSVLERILEPTRPGAARNRGRVIRWRSTSEAQHRVALRVSLLLKLRYDPVSGKLGGSREGMPGDG